MRLAKNFMLALAALALVSAACATRDGGAAQSGSSGAGGETRMLFERNCAACHGPQGEGKQIGTLKVPSLREGRPATDPDARLLAQIHDGGNGMPPFKYTLTDEQIQDLLRFLREELQGRAPAR
jgi:mono/diheme cytochrome c family protein